MTIFALLIQVCGFSHREAADYFNIRRDTVRSWSLGRRSPPSEVIDRLVGLASRLDAAADQAVAQVADSMIAVEPDDDFVVELGLASDDHEAQTLGWPCVGVHRSVIGLTVARGMAEGYKFAAVPRGSTSASAAAADVHDKFSREGEKGEQR